MPKLPTTHGARRVPTKPVNTRCDECGINFDTASEKRRHVCDDNRSGLVKCPICRVEVTNTVPCPECGVFACRR